MPADTTPPPLDPVRLEARMADPRWRVLFDRFVRMGHEHNLAIVTANHAMAALLEWEAAAPAPLVTEAMVAAFDAARADAYPCSHGEAYRAGLEAAIRAAAPAPVGEEVRQAMALNVAYWHGRDFSMPTERDYREADSHIATLLAALRQPASGGDDIRAELVRCYELAQRLDAQDPSAPGAFTGSVAERLERHLQARTASGGAT